MGTGFGTIPMKPHVSVTQEAARLEDICNMILLLLFNKLSKLDALLNVFIFQ